MNNIARSENQTGSTSSVCWIKWACEIILYTFTVLAVLTFVLLQYLRDVPYYSLDRTLMPKCLGFRHSERTREPPFHGVFFFDMTLWCIHAVNLDHES